MVYSIRSLERRNLFCLPTIKVDDMKKSAFLAVASILCAVAASSAPFDLSSAGSSPVVPVTFDVSGGLPERSVSVPAFTVAAATAQNLPVTGVSPVRGYAVRVAAVPGNGEVTYWATFSRAGMHITVR